jgi:hypothetical protein
MMDEDPARAMDIAMGREHPPKGVTPEAFLIGVENRAMAAGDFDTVYALRNSDLAAEGTKMGQRISTYRTRAKSSPVEAMKDVQRAREKALGRDVGAAKAEGVAQIHDEIADATPDHEAFSNFLNTLEC